MRDRDTQQSMIDKVLPTRGESRAPASNRGDTAGESCDRGQTSIDLLLAVTIFFAGVTLLTVTSPYLFFPSDLSATDERVTADTIANELINGKLTEAGVSGLSHAETNEFIQNEDPNNIVSVGSDQDIFVTLSTNTTDPPTAFEGQPTGPDNNRYIVTKGTEPSSISSTVERQTTLHGKAVSVTVEIGPEP